MKTAELLPSLYTRNEVVDVQHKELIKRINDLYAALASEDEATRAAKAEETLNFLAEYTVFHFASEEELMQNAKYPLFTEHKAKHDAFVETVKGLHADLVAGGPTDAFAEKVEEEVTNWLINHIKGTDMQAIEWINNKSGDQMQNLQ